MSEEYTVEDSFYDTAIEYEDAEEQMNKAISDYEKAYGLAKDYIAEHGILRWFWNMGEEWSRAIYKAINDFGVLSDEEQLVYNKVVYNQAENRVWYQGGWRSVDGYTDDEISGVKKFLAHSYVICMHERGLNIYGTRDSRVDNS